VRQTTKFAFDRQFELHEVFPPNYVEDEDTAYASRSMKTYQDFLILSGLDEFPGFVVVYNWKEGGESHDQGDNVRK
jgi:hypothetical protein